MNLGPGLKLNAALNRWGYTSNSVWLTNSLPATPFPPHLLLIFIFVTLLLISARATPVRPPLIWFSWFRRSSSPGLFLAFYSVPFPIWVSWFSFCSAFNSNIARYILPYSALDYSVACYALFSIVVLWFSFCFILFSIAILWFIVHSFLFSVFILYFVFYSVLLSVVVHVPFR
jgi:hypothetical protein